MARACRAGSAASVSARTTAIRLAPAATTPGTSARSIPPIAKNGFVALAAAYATSSTHRRPPRFGRRRVHRSDADVVDVRVGAGGVDLLRRVGRAPHQRPGAGSGARRGRRAVVLPDVDAVGAGAGDQVGAIVQHEQCPELFAGSRESLRDADDLAIRRVLHPQLHDLDPARERGVQEAARLLATDEIQPSRGEPITHNGHGY
jgi:hypothetical protein